METVLKEKVLGRILNITSVLEEMGVVNQDDLNDFRTQARLEGERKAFRQMLDWLCEPELMESGE